MPQRRPGKGPAALGILVAVTLGAACTATAPQPVHGAGAGNRPAEAPAPAADSPAAGHPGTSAQATGDPAVEEPLGAAPPGPGDPTPEAPRPGAVTLEAPRPTWSPEAARAGRRRGEVASPPSPAREYGATTATAPPEAVEVLPGPSLPDRSDSQGPVALVPSRRGGDPPADVATAILEAYAAFWDSYWAAATHPVNPGHPGIERHSTEPLRSRAVGVLRGRAAAGIALRLPADHGADRITHIEGWDADSAEVLDCFVDEAVLYEVSTGRVRNDEQATVVHLALMRRERGAWRVAEIFEQAIHAGRTNGCIMQATTPGRPEAPAAAPAAQAAPAGGDVVGAARSPS